MAARPIWRGQIRLALVSIPVEIYPATRSGASIQFHQVHEPSGKRIKYEKVVPGIGPVDRDEIVKGYEVSKGHYVLLDQEEIEAVKLESRKTLDLVQFVDLGDIDPMYFDKPYYVVPSDDLAEEAYYHRHLPYIAGAAEARNPRLRGAKALVFTAGIGENSHQFRALVGERLAAAGLGRVNRPGIDGGSRPSGHLTPR